MGRCFKKKKAKIPRKKVKGKSFPNYGPPSTSSDTRTAKEKFDANPARKASVARKKRKQKKAKQAAARQAALDAQTSVDVVEEQAVETVTPEGEAEQLPMDTVEITPNDENFPTGPTSETDLETATGGSVGETAVTAESVYQRNPEEAISDQERLAQAELRRQRIKRARLKQSLLRRRLERSREVGSGRRVLSGTERELNIQSRQAGTGRRRGAGRRSLITGSTGGIGYYSRFL